MPNAKARTQSSAKPEKILICSRIDRRTWTKEEIKRGNSHEISSIESSLKKKGFKTKTVTFKEYDDFKKLSEETDKFRPDIILADFHTNITKDHQKKAWIFDACENCKITHVFGSKKIMKSMLDKGECQKKLSGKGVECLPSIKADSKDKNKIKKFVQEHGKVVIKPLKGYCSCGISLTDNPQTAVEKVKEIEEEFKQPALVEKYVKGREYQVMVVGNGEDRLIMPVELIKKTEIYDFKSKYNPKITKRIRVDDKEKENRLKSLGKKITDILEVADYTRMEILEHEGKFYPIDINGIPTMEKYFNGGPATLTQFAKLFGKTHEDLMEKIVVSAYNRSKTCN